MSNQGNQSIYGKSYTADEEGNRHSFIGFIDISERKECPNCFDFFIKNDNLRCKHEENGDLVSRFYVCPACGCRINTMYKFSSFVKNDEVRWTCEGPTSMF